MARYVILLRGINVGGKNKLSMRDLKESLEGFGYENVATYINSGNVIANSKKSARAIEAEIEAALPKRFRLDSDLIRVLALPRAKYRAMVDGRPRGFGDDPAKYHSDAIFLLDGLSMKDAVAAFDPRDGVDTMWTGEGIIYHQRLSAERTKTRLNKVMGSPVYKSMTVRNWATTLKLLEMLEA